MLADVLLAELPRLPNMGMTGVVVLARVADVAIEKNSTPWPLAPIALRSGAPRFEEPVPR